MSEKQRKENLERYDDTCVSLAAHKNLLLIVEVSTPEEADELLRWMYSKTSSPMKSKLQEISWNKRIVTQQEHEAILAIRKILQ